MSLEKLRDKRVFRSDGVPCGKAVLLAECGRVMAVLDLNDLPDDALALTDTVCLNSADAAALDRRSKAEPAGRDESPE